MEPNTLVVNISSARGLYLKNHNTLDAVASITLKGKGSTKSRVITEVITCETDCKWDENCEFKLNEKSTHLDVTVNHKGKLGNDIIGKVEIPLDQAKRIGGHQWFPLKKRKDDDKYRGEVQLQFAFHYEKPSLSISNSELNMIGKESFADKMKRKMQKLGGGKTKQAEDTMSVASGVSAFSVKSTRSHRFMNKLNKTFGSLHKSSTLPNNGASFDLGADESFESSNSFGANNYLAPPGGVPRPSSYGSDLNFRDDVTEVTPSLSVNAANISGLSNCSTAAPISPTVSTAESFHRANSVRSVASSGFGSSKLPLNQNINGNRDLLAMLDSLRLELQVKDSRLQDMQDYMDTLISRVMERCPEVLAAPLAPQKAPKRRYF